MDTGIKKPILVMGVGNLIQTDDGVGVHVVQKLQDQDLGPETEVFDGGTLGIDLLPWIEGREYLIVIDALKAEAEPGTIFRFQPDDLDYDDAPKTSIHQLGLIDSLRMAALTGFAPKEVVIFAVQPQLIDWGEELTAPVREAAEKLVGLIKKELQRIYKQKSAIMLEA